MFEKEMVYVSLGSPDMVYDPSLPGMGIGTSGIEINVAVAVAV